MIKERHFEREGRGRRGPWGPPLGGWRGQHRHGGRARGRRPGGDPRPAGRAADARLRGHPRAGRADRWRVAAEPVLFPTLQMLEDEGLVSVEEAEVASGTR